MLRFAAVISCALTMAGCAGGGQMRWVKPGATSLDFDQDKTACEYEAAKATASGGNFGMQSAIGAGIAEGMKRNELGTICMRTKGWSQQMQAAAVPQSEGGPLPLE